METQPEAADRVSMPTYDGRRDAQERLQQRSKALTRMHSWTKLPAITF
jgi:hypothetical protein